MDLRWPLMWLLLGLVPVVVGLAWLLRPGSLRPGSATLVAHTDLLRRLPRYATLVRRRRLWAAWSALAALVMVVGSVWLAARPSAVTTQQPTDRSRDIMLCLDSSTSMTDENVEVIATFRKLVDQLEGERIGLTIFNGAAVPVFPLTDDYDFVREQLDEAEQKLAAEDYDYVAGTILEYGGGSSLVGDGLVTCAQSFDRPETERGRAIVLASDNDQQGTAIYSMAEAGEYAAARSIVVYGIGSPDLAHDSILRSDFEDAVTPSGGRLTLLGQGEPTAEIVAGIQQLERTRLQQPAQPIYHDKPFAPTVVVCLGALMLAGGWVGEWVARRRGEARPAPPAGATTGSDSGSGVAAR